MARCTVVDRGASFAKVQALGFALLALLALPALTKAALPPAGAASLEHGIALRGFEADSMLGPTRIVADPAASDGDAILLDPAHPALRRVDMLDTSALQLTLASGCSANAAVRVRVDGRGPITFGAGTPALHRVGAPFVVPAGLHTIALRAVLPRGEQRPCADPEVDRLDFIPANAGDGVMLGAAMSAVDLAENPPYRRTFTTDFDSLTPGNELKMEIAEPAQGQYNFAPADQLVNYALAHGDAIRGHTLVYGSQLPPWVTAPLLPWTAAGLLGVLRDYITTVMQHYRGKISTWDVVNEAFNADGSYRRNLFYEVIGPTYIADAFRFARAADPSAALFYNDLDDTVDGPKSEAILAMVSDFQQHGVPIDGIGLEAHTDVPGAPSEDAIESMMARYAALGLRVEITEMDVGTKHAPGTLAAKDAAQASAFRNAATACWDIAACPRMTTWGVGDAITWIGSAQAPLLFDMAYRPKPAFFAVEAALHRLVPG